MSESQEVYSEPYLESEEHEGCEYAYSCLEQSALVAEYSADACCKQHDEHYKIWNLLIISDYNLRTFRSYNGRHTAEEHGNCKCSRRSYI